ncbi:MAG: hypothetical protein LBE22_10635 [Azoarcus sp.]|nr:hypothetical protein [Azoarcus sp.]
MDVGWVELAKPNVFAVGWMLGFASLIPTYAGFTNEGEVTAQALKEGREML